MALGSNKVPYLYGTVGTCTVPLPQTRRQPARELETEESSGPLWMSRERDGYDFYFHYFQENFLILNQLRVGRAPELFALGRSLLQCRETTGSAV